MSRHDPGNVTPPAFEVSLTVNSKPMSAHIEPRTLLVYLIRDTWGLTGAKIGCDTSQCGACTVLFDGRAVKSCTVLAAQADGAAVITIEGLQEQGSLTELQQQFHKRHAVQCGFCTPGMVMTATALISDGVVTSEAAVREGLAGNICRCTGYGPIIEAVLAAAGAASTSPPAAASAAPEANHDGPQTREIGGKR